MVPCPRARFVPVTLLPRWLARPRGRCVRRRGRSGCMLELKKRLRAVLTAAMKARDDVRTRTLRMALTSVTNEEVAGPAARELTDDEGMRVLTREAKKRKDAAEAFDAAGRENQAAAERAE